MFKFFLVVHTLIAAALVGVILMQRSEGGGFAGGGSPTGLLSARGAGDFLTRTTAILATLFITLSIGLAALATINRAPVKLDDSLKKVAPASALPGLPGMPAPATTPAVTPTTGEVLPAAAGALPVAVGAGAATVGQSRLPQLTEQQILNMSAEQFRKVSPEQFGQLSPNQRRRIATELDRRNKAVRAREQQGQLAPTRATVKPESSEIRTNIPKVQMPSIIQPAPKPVQSIPSLPAGDPVTTPKVGPQAPDPVPATPQ